MKTKTSVFSASDYAGLGTEKYAFYYGYEETDEEDNWCFTTSEQESGKEIVRYSSVELGVVGEYPEIALLHGIGKFIQENL